MRIDRLSALGSGAVVTADLVIVGGGPAGLTVAAQTARPGRRVLVLESGLETENPAHAALNEVESVNQPHSDAQVGRRRKFHGSQAEHWSHDLQAFGVRCRALGGSTHAWAGKSAPFDRIDFEERPWVPNSGWPVSRQQIEPYVERALDELNLCPVEPPARFDEAGLRSFYWQFARSRVDRLDVMRFGRELIARRPDHLQVLTDATVTHVGLTPDGTRFSHLHVAGLDGGRARVEARTCVLAASGIENARLLLASNDVHAGGIGNGHDLVGRYLLDHAGARIGCIPPAGMAALLSLFGFYGLNHGRRAHIFMHGLALSPDVQERDQLLNASLYFIGQRAPDDPWDALKRLLHRQSPSIGRDLLSVASSPGLLVKGGVMKLLTEPRTPKLLKDLVVNTAIRVSPNRVAEEFQDRGLPHKLTGLEIEAISEQLPNPDSRITLGNRTDQFGLPIARVDWRINGAERRTLLRLAELSHAALTQAGLPPPALEPWVADRRPEDITIIDMAHTLGTTRMADDPKSGVVDRHCRVHGLPNLYVAGGSVFPTSGHANPTLMILAFAIRLADRLNAELERA